MAINAAIGAFVASPAVSAADPGLKSLCYLAFGRKEEEKRLGDLVRSFKLSSEMMTFIGVAVGYFVDRYQADMDDKKLVRQFEMEVDKATAQLRKKFAPVVPSLAEQTSRVETSKATREEKEKALLFLTMGLDVPPELDFF